MVEDHEREKVNTKPVYPLPLFVTLKLFVLIHLLKIYLCIFQPIIKNQHKQTNKQ